MLTHEEIKALDITQHTCAKCSYFLNKMERRIMTFNAAEQTHTHTCTKCGFQWKHRNPRLDASGLI